MIQVWLKKGEGRGLSSGGLWVYDNEIDRVSGTITDGDLVQVFAFNDYGLGVGFYNSASKIRIRLLSRNVNAVIDEAFFAKRVEEAVSFREKTIGLGACRLVFGEADHLPGLTVDLYEDVLVVQSLALGIDRHKTLILSLIKEALQKRGITIRGIYERSDAKVRKLEGMELFKGFLSAPFDTQVPITENGVKYLVDVENGQKTGFFLDQKLNRKAIWPMAKGAEVLDCFTHTGSFALNAAKAGAKHVLACDASDTAIEQAKKNAGLNGLSSVVDFVVEDVFLLLPRLIEVGKRFDLVILDPPAFTKSRESVKAAVKGYREINIKGMKLVKPGGFFATCSCSHFMTQELFVKMLHEAAKGAGVSLRQIEARAQSPDHPVLWGADESYYLKFYIFQIMKND